MAEGRSFCGTLFLIFLGVVALVLLATAIGELPSYRQVVPGTHAVQKHGADALTAREALRACKNMKMQLCPEVPTKGYGLTVCYWCETGSSICPGAYATIGAKEKTAFLRPCYQWRNCQ